MVKLNKTQQSKYDFIRGYLAQMEKYNYLLIDSDYTNVYQVTALFHHGTWLAIRGKDVSGRKITEQLHPSDLNEVYRKCMKDEDFKNWVDNQPPNEGQCQNIDAGCGRL